MNGAAFAFRIENCLTEGVGQLVAQSLPTPEDCSLNPDAGINLSTTNCGLVEHTPHDREDVVFESLLVLGFFLLFFIFSVLNT